MTRTKSALGHGRRFTLVQPMSAQPPHAAKKHPQTATIGHTLPRHVRYAEGTGSPIWSDVQYRGMSSMGQEQTLVLGVPDARFGSEADLEASCGPMSAMLTRADQCGGALTGAVSCPVPNLVAMLLRQRASIQSMSFMVPDA